MWATTSRSRRAQSGAPLCDKIHRSAALFPGTCRNLAHRRGLRAPTAPPPHKRRPASRPWAVRPTHWPPLDARYRNRWHSGGPLVAVVSHVPSPRHQALVHLFLDRPSLLASLVRRNDVRGVRIEGALRHDLTEPTDVLPSGLRADAVFLVGDPPHLALVVEVQLRARPDKRYTWPAYLGNLRKYHRCPVLLVVVCPDQDVADWAREPIALGPGWSLTPVVIGPRSVPRADRVPRAQLTPQLAMVSALFYPIEPVLRVVYPVLLTLEDHLLSRYLDILARCCPDAVRVLETLMPANAELEHRVLSLSERAHLRGREEGLEAGREEGLEAGREEGLEAGREAGREAGLRAALRMLIATRQLEIPDDLETRLARADAEQLQAWIARAAVAEPGSSVLDG